jgi:hypothetical protein
MNNRRFQLYFRLGAVVLALSGLANVMVVVEHRSLAESSSKMAAQSAEIEQQLPGIDRLARELAVAGSPDPAIGNIMRQAGIVISLPSAPMRPETNNVPATNSSPAEIAPTVKP